MCACAGRTSLPWRARRVYADASACRAVVAPRNGLHWPLLPFNSAVESVLLEMGTRRLRPSDSHEPVFPRRYREPDKFFPKAVKRAQEALREAGHDDEAARLRDFTWHGLRHTWASRLTMAGVDPRTLQTLGNWKSLEMVVKYSHLSPDHLRSAIEKLVAPPGQANGTPRPAAELDVNLTSLQDENPVLGSAYRK
jgi:Phage integrase family